MPGHRGRRCFLLSSSVIASAVGAFPAKIRPKKCGGHRCPARLVGLRGRMAPYGRLRHTAIRTCKEMGIAQAFNTNAFPMGISANSQDHPSGGQHAATGCGHVRRILPHGSSTAKTRATGSPIALRTESRQVRACAALSGGLAAGSRVEPHGNAGGRHVPLGLADREGAEVEDGGGQHGAGMAVASRPRPDDRACRRRPRRSPAR